MHWGLRLLIFTAPVILATICKVTVASANGGTEFELFVENPHKLVDISFDLLLTAASIVLGLLFYVRGNAGTITAPGGGPVNTGDVVICGFVTLCCLILIFALSIAVPRVDYIRMNFNSLFTIWLPNLFGLIALAWVVRKLT